MKLSVSYVMNAVVSLLDPLQDQGPHSSNVQECWQLMALLELPLSEVMSPPQRQTMSSDLSMYLKA